MRNEDTELADRIFLRGLYKRPSVYLIMLYRNCNIYRKRYRELVLIKTSRIFERFEKTPESISEERQNVKE